MSKSSNNQGRAYEYACLTSLHGAIKAVRPAEILHNSSFDAAKKAWDTLSETNRLLYTLSAQSTIKTIFALEPNIIENGEDVLNLYIQNDKRGQAGDIRDIIVERKDILWEIGFSVKHNHEAVKHSRLSDKNDFSKKWYDVKCSKTYWDDVKPVFDLLKAEKQKGTLFDDLTSKEERVYIPILKAFMGELKRQISTDPSIPQKMVAYLLSKYDFYKVISLDRKRVTTVQSFNMYGTLNKPSRTKQADLKAPAITLPQTLLFMNFKPGSSNTIIMCFENGWQFSFRIHNAEKQVKTSLKFDVRIVGMPAEINIKFNCNW